MTKEGKEGVQERARSSVNLFSSQGRRYKLFQKIIPVKSMFKDYIFSGEENKY